MSETDELLQKLDVLSRIGATPEDGVRRIAATQADKAGRDLIVQWMREAGLTVEIDRIGNIFGALAGGKNLPAVMTGSHIDSVGNGGKLDGPLGVIAGLVIASALNKSGKTPARQFVVAVFTNEEGVRFQPDMMGSLVFAGGLNVETARAARDRDGVRLGEALDEIGYTGALPCGAKPPAFFVELHIEQGPVLEANHTTIGAVEAVQGIYWTGVTITGQANHAGTTPMAMRKDAGYAAARIAVEARTIAQSIDGQVATIGEIDLTPNLVNVVAGRAYLTVDLRNADAQRLTEAQDRLESVIETVADEEGVEIATESLVRFAPVQFAPSIVKIVEDAAKDNGYSVARMVSGAGHDAQMMARLCPSAMIFVPSVNGVSHNPAEHTAEKDIAAGYSVLKRTIETLLQTR
ncbi:M20 family metallo-hydrolase [Hyphococcus sp.]|uniref:M20 family metallo-hydrolase n=1 Tax=Hyphococcus sp. TaxID=2038636 RepID=UPI003CCC0667